MDTTPPMSGTTDADVLDTTGTSATRINVAAEPLTKRNKGGHPKGTANLHSKQMSAISTRLKLSGVDWIPFFGAAIKRNDKALLTIWLRLLPYLIVTAGHRRPRKLKGRASKAALAALAELESE
jgi:hypothetical protein